MPPPNTPVDGTTTPQSTQPSQPAQSSQSSQSVSRPTSSIIMDASQVKTALVKMDYQAIDYVNPVDETLICPICRTAFHSPITTPCGHTFCAKCINRALERQRVCPIDRQPIDKTRDYRPIPLIIKEQLDRLEARCPNQGCDYVCARENLEAHYERHCEFTLVHCSKPSCDKLVARHLCSIEGQCMHEMTNCDFCLKPVAFVDLDAHWEQECEAAFATCPDCDASVSVVNNSMLKHIQQECPEAMAKCKWDGAGCRVTDKRRIVREHERNGCMYETVGRLLEQQAEDRRIIQDLTRRLASLEAVRDTRRRERRRDSAATINDRTATATAAGGSLTNPTTSTSTPADSTTWESPHNYMLAQFERLESHMEELREMVCEMDMRQSASFLHHSKQVADRFLELGDKVGVLSMHTKWLLNMQYMQRNAQLRAANAASLAAAAAGAGGAGLSGGSDGLNHGGESSSGAGSSSDSGLRYQGSRRGSEGRIENLTRL
ncbi:hypothetical protein VTJ49DRAFT_4711 [Mycothermus thermophilus]|uniref:Uncharacterized protein n=1 Tax=Humicola insolens TaxID=85995 RepID=A0ABR3V4P4_HUMIN